jgi:hypothetical protein
MTAPDITARTRTIANMLTPAPLRLDTPSVSHPIRRKIMANIHPFACGCEICSPHPKLKFSHGTIAAWSAIAGIVVAVLWFFMGVTPA